jgi:hypothetical protein
MNTFRASAEICLLLFLAGCRRDRPPSRVETTAVAPPPQPAESSAAAPVKWNVGAGPVLLVPGDAPTRALIIVPADNNQAILAALPRPASATLFSRAGVVQTADLPSVADSAGCVVASLSAAPPPRPWSVGFIGGVVAPLPVDSIGSLSSGDSSRYATWLNRLASALPNDSSGRFAGLPFGVRSISRFGIPDGPQVVVGTLSRQLNQEATPLQERTFLIAEQARGDSTVTVAYGERSYGEEETIESRELLAALLISDARTPAVVVSRDFGNEVAYAVFERVGESKWRNQWSSARHHCGP